jgi:site-specific DNA recombinase
MRTAIYARVSTDRQGRDQTIDSRLAALRRWAEARGHELRPEHVFADDGYSGSRLDRPALDRLRDAAFAGEFDVLAVHSPDRLARRYAYQVLLLEEFRKAGCDVEFVERPISDAPRDQLLLQIQGAVAEYERALLGERFRRGKLQKARAGHWVSGRAPYGYRHVPKRDGVPGHLEVDEAEAAVVRLMYGWLIDEQMTLRQILKRLSEGPWRPRCGRRLWAATVVHRILSDPLYAGTAYANRCTAVETKRPRTPGPPGRLNCRRPRPRSEWIAIPVPPIVDDPTHQRALAQLERNAALSFRNNARHEYLLRCLLTCRTCGLAMFGVVHHAAEGRPSRRYYKCHGKDCVCRDRDRRCPQAATKAEDLEAAVWGHIKQLLGDPATLLAQFEEQARQADAAADDGPKLEAQLRRLDREEQRLIDAYQAEAIDVAELEERRGQVQLRRQALAAERQRSERERSRRQQARGICDELSAFCGRIRSRLEEATLPERQRILQLLIERVIVGEESLEIRHVIPLRGLGPEPTRPIPSRDDPGGGTEGGDTTRNGPGARLRSDGVELAPLPRHAGQPGVQRRLEPGVGVADHELDPVQPPGVERPQEVPPVGLGLRERDAHAEDRSLALRVDPDGDQDGAGAHLAAMPDVLVPRIQDQVGRLADRAAPPPLQLRVEGLGGPTDPRAGHLRAAERLGDGGDLAGRAAPEIHLGHGQLQGPLAADALLQGRGVGLDAAGLRDLDGERPEPGVDGPGLGAVGVSGTALGPLIRPGPRGVRAFDLHDLVERAVAAEARPSKPCSASSPAIGSGAVVCIRWAIVGRSPLVSVGTFQGNRRWPAASRPADFTESRMLYRRSHAADIPLNQYAGLDKE